MALSGTIFKLLGQITAAVLLYKIIVFVWIYFLKPSKISKYTAIVNGKESWALVTGASDGIGLDTTRELLGEGFSVILHGRNPTKLKNVTFQLRKDFPKQNTLFIVADAVDALPSANHVATEVQALMKKHNGRLSVLINNVGGTIRCNSRAFYTVAEADDENILKTSSLNALFPHVLTRLLLPTLQEDGKPSLIVIVGSMGGFTGMPYIAAYSSSKSANHAFATALSEEMTCTGSNVEVLGVVAGTVETTGNKFTKPEFGTISSAQMAQDIIARVGCGIPCVVGNWRHAIQGEGINYIPDWLAFSIKRKILMELKRREEKML